VANSLSSLKVSTSKMAIWPIFLVYLIPATLPGYMIVSAIITLIVMISYLAFHPLPMRVFVPASLFCILMIFLNFFALLWDYGRFIERDVFELVKYLYIFVCMIFGGAFFNSIESEEVVKKVIFRVCIFVILFGLLEVFLPDTFFFIRQFYARIDKSILFAKPITFFWTTYFAASVYVYLACLTLASIIINRDNNIYHIVFVLLLVLVILTQSRSAFLTLSPLILIYLYVALKRRSKIIWTAVFALAIFVAVFWQSLLLFFENISSSYLLYGIKNYLFDFQNARLDENSLALRIQQIVWSYENNDLVIVGAGIGKAYNEYLESWVALYYYRYGLLGMSSYIILWYAPLLYVIISKKGKQIFKANVLVMGVVLFSIFLPLLSLSSVITDQIRLSPIFYSFLGGVYLFIFDQRKRILWYKQK